MPRAAIISANTELVRFFELELFMCGFACIEYKNPVALSDDIDVIISDKDTVNQNGIQNSNIPTIFVTSGIPLNETEEGIVLSWPADISDIRNALMWAVGGTYAKKIPMHKDIHASDAIYVIDRQNYVIALGERHVKLSKTEFMLLNELCVHNGRTVSRQNIMKLLGAEGGNISDVYICALRKKLELSTGKRLIFTDRGVGYHTNLKMIE